MEMVNCKRVMHVDKVRASLRSIRDLVIGKHCFILYIFNLILCVVRGLISSNIYVYFFFAYKYYMIII